MASKFIPRLHFNDKGEHLINIWPQVDRPIKAFSLGWAGYMYFLYWLDPDSSIGKFRSSSLTIFGTLGALIVMRFRKFTCKLSLLRGGEHILIERYPTFGFGHLNVQTVSVASIKGVHIYGLSKWYNPMRLGRGLYKIKYERYIGSFAVRDSAVFRLTANADRDVFKIVGMGRTVTERALAALAKAKAKS
jgi:hypothetical protein